MKKSELLSSLGKVFEIFRVLANAVMERGGSDDDLFRLLKEPQLVSKIADLIMAPPVFPVWKTIRLGTHKSVDDISQALQEVNCKVSDWARDMLGQPAFTMASEPTEVSLVIASVAELGFKDGAKYADICRRANKFGLVPCPAEAGPALREQYLDQPMNECLTVAMELITDSDGYLRLFYVGRSVDGLWLSSYYGSPDGFWISGYRFVFLPASN